MACLCGGEDTGDGDGGWDLSTEHPSHRHHVHPIFWSPNALANSQRLPFGLTFRRRWRELERQLGILGDPALSSLHTPGSPPAVPPELYSCYLEATAGRTAQFDAASYSTGTMSSGISSWHEASWRSRSSSSSRGSWVRRRSPSIERHAAYAQGNRHRSPSEDRRWNGGSRNNSRHRRGRHKSVDPSVLLDRSEGLSLPPSGSCSSPESSMTVARVSRSKGKVSSDGVARAHSLGRLSAGSGEHRPRPPARRRRGLNSCKKVYLFCFFFFIYIYLYLYYTYI